MKVCLKCNKDNNNDGEYCVFCGEKLTEEESKIKENAALFNSKYRERTSVWK